MANNVTVTAGSGTSIASDDVAGVHYQVVKLAAGDEDSAARIGGDATNGIDVDVTRLPALVAGTAAIGKLAANSGVDIGDVDVTSVIPGTGATNLGKVEDAAHTTGDVGVMALGVRNDAGTTLATTTGDYIPLSMDANGALRVSGAGGGTQYVEDAAHTTGDTGTLLLAVRNDAGTVLAGTTLDYIPLSVDASGYLRVNMAAGTLSLLGEDHIGEVGGRTPIIRPTITVSITPDYSIGDVVGGEITLTNALRISAGSGVLGSITMSDATNTKPELDLMFFNSNPTATHTDNSAFPSGDADNPIRLGFVTILTTDWKTFGDGACATKALTGLGIKASGSADLFMVIVTRTAINFAATDDLMAAIAVLQD